MTDWQKFNQLLADVKAMRAAQKKYYNTKQSDDLRTAKALEGKVDKIISYHDEHKQQIPLFK